MASLPSPHVPQDRRHVSFTKPGVVMSQKPLSAHGSSQTSISSMVATISLQVLEFFKLQVDGISSLHSERLNKSLSEMILLRIFFNRFLTG